MFVRSSPVRRGTAKAWLAFAIFHCGVRLGLGQDAAPVSLDFGPEKAVPRKNAQEAVATAAERGVVDLRVRYVKVEGRWAGRVALPLTVGDTLTNEKLSASLNALRAAITSRPNLDIGVRSKGEVGVLYIYVDYDTSMADGTVGVTFKPYYVDIALVEIGKNVLPVPRSPWATFYQNVPAALRAFNPGVSLSRDRAFGTAISASFAGDPLTLFAGNDSGVLNHQMDLHGEGTKSLEKDFYRANGGVSYSLQTADRVFEEFTFSADFDGAREPLGTGEHSHDAGLAALALRMTPGPNARLYLHAGYRYSRDSFRDGETGMEIDTTTDAQTGRLLFDAIPPGIEGFFRGAIWEEGAWRSDDTYQRLVIRLGYEKEIALAPNQTIGIEIVTGGGRAFGDVPGYAQFFGGNAPGQFLYDGASSNTLIAMPTGPLIRSLGENEARLGDGPGTLGGESFWHFNLNVSIPIPAWSMPLIPNEVIDFGGSSITIKQLLRRQIDVTGPSMLAAVLQEQGMDAEAAAKEAKRILQEVTPATHFIIDDANLYSIKPLLMFDAAGMSGHGTDETWLGAGAGFQVTVVTAKLEAGYMRTISGPTYGEKGNAFVRLVFQNLF